MAVTTTGVQELVGSRQAPDRTQSPRAWLMKYQPLRVALGDGLGASTRTR